MSVQLTPYSNDIINKRQIQNSSSNSNNILNLLNNPEIKQDSFESPSKPKDKQNFLTYAATIAIFTSAVFSLAAFYSSKKQTADSNSVFKGLKTSVSKLAQNIEELQKNNPDNLTTQNKNILEQIKSLQGEIEKLSLKKGDSTKTSSQIKHLQEAIETLSKKVEEIKPQEVSKISSALGEVQKTISSFEKQVKELQSKLNISDITKQISSLEQTINSLNQKNPNANQLELMAQMQKKTEEISKQISSLQVSKDSDTKELRQMLESTRKQITKIQEQNQGLNIAIGSIKPGSDSKELMSSLSSVLENIDSQLLALSQKNPQDSTPVDEVAKAAIKKLDSAFEQGTDKLNQASSRLNETIEESELAAEIILESAEEAIQKTKQGSESLVLELVEQLGTSSEEIQKEMQRTGTGTIQTIEVQGNKAIAKIYQMLDASIKGTTKKAQDAIDAQSKQAIQKISQIPVRKESAEIKNSKYMEPKFMDATAQAMGRMEKTPKTANLVDNEGIRNCLKMSKQPIISSMTYTKTTPDGSKIDIDIKDGEIIRSIKKDKDGKLIFEKIYERKKDIIKEETPDATYDKLKVIIKNSENPSVSRTLEKEVQKVEGEKTGHSLTSIFEINEDKKTKTELTRVVEFPACTITYDASRGLDKCRVLRTIKGETYPHGFDVLPGIGYNLDCKNGYAVFKIDEDPWYVYPMLNSVYSLPNTTIPEALKEASKNKYFKMPPASELEEAAHVRDFRKVEIPPKEELQTTCPLENDFQTPTDKE